MQWLPNYQLNLQKRLFIYFIRNLHFFKLLDIDIDSLILKLNVSIIDNNISCSFNNLNSNSLDCSIDNLLIIYNYYDLSFNIIINSILINIIDSPIINPSTIFIIDNINDNNIPLYDSSSSDTSIDSIPQFSTNTNVSAFQKMKLKLLKNLLSNLSISINNININLSLDNNNNLYSDSIISISIDNLSFEKNSFFLLNKLSINFSSNNYNDDSIYFSTFESLNDTTINNNTSNIQINLLSIDTITLNADNPLLSSSPSDNSNLLLNNNIHILITNPILNLNNIIDYIKPSMLLNLYDKFFKNNDTNDTNSISILSSLPDISLNIDNFKLLLSNNISFIFNILSNISSHNISLSISNLSSFYNNNNPILKKLPDFNPIFLNLLYQSKINNISIVFNNFLHLNIFDLSIILEFSSFLKNFTTFLNSFPTTTNTTSTSTSTNLQLDFNIPAFIITLSSIPNTFINLSLNYISYSNSLLIIDNIKLSNNLNSNLLLINNINYKYYLKKIFDFSSFNENFTQFNYLTNSIINIDNITLNYNDSIIIDYFNLLSENSISNDNNNNNDTSSNTNIIKNLIKFTKIDINNIDLNFFDNLLTSNIKKSLIFISSDFKIINILSHNSINLSYSNYNIIENNNINTKNSKPIFLLSIKPMLKKFLLIFSNNNFNYYTSIIKKLTTQNDPYLKPNKLISIPLLPFLEFKFFDCSLNLYPYHLNTSITLIIHYFILNLSNSTSTDLKIIGLLKSANILLLDDIVTNKKKYNNNTNLSITTMHNKNNLLNHFNNLGYSSIGRLENFSLSFETSPINILPFLINLKINIISLSLCADSFNTLIQTLLDFKIQLLFPDEKKFNFHNNNEELNIFNDIDNSFFKINPDIHQFNEEFLEITKNDLLITRKKIDKSILPTSIDFKINENYLNDLEKKIDSDFEKERKNLNSNNNNKSIILSNNDETFILSLIIDSLKIKLFDGFDWKFTRHKFNNLIDSLNDNTLPINNKNIKPLPIFESIYITPNEESIPNLKKFINKDIQGDSQSTSLNLKPSKNYKILINLDGLNVKFTSFPFFLEKMKNFDSNNLPKSKNISNILIILKSLKVIDNLPNSTWNTMITTNINRNHHNIMSNFCEINLNNFLSTDFLASIESILDIKVTPIRLHLDRNTVEFIIRFFGFTDHRFDIIPNKDEQLSNDPIFLQKFTFNKFDLLVDYKPKKIDYSVLRSGYTSELMNFFGLENAKIKFKSCILYGQNGPLALIRSLQNIWLPDIIYKQLPNILSGISMVNPIINLSKDLKSMIKAPINEYKDNGHIMRGLHKSGNIFLKTATGDFIKLGIKLSAGMQTILEDTEENVFGGIGSKGRSYQSSNDKTSLNVESYLKEDQLLGKNNPMIHNHTPKALIIEQSVDNTPTLISLYANQPLDIHEGLEDAYSSLEKNIHIAYDSLWKDTNNGNATNSISAAAVSIAKAAPVAIIRPLIGTTEAITKTLQGLSNQFNKEQEVIISGKYKHAGSPKKHNGEHS